MKSLADQHTLLSMHSSCNGLVIECDRQTIRQIENTNEFTAITNALNTIMFCIICFQKKIFFEENVIWHQNFSNKMEEREKVEKKRNDTQTHRPREREREKTKL